ncbi:MAG: oligopeptide ABC transporter ATP-binding protein OppF [Halobacteriovorax sp.]|nr:oligopeptide ABC transporter ATP-binding protein OppF [Halobacteriovorax sp.]|tara:strand:+ start:31372 stop:32313 length:942 start_codon:yes stop_codon:yes gene_type:complete
MSVLDVKNIKKHYDVKTTFGSGGLVKALDGISFEAKAKKTLGIVGESGCGKSTLARQLMRLEEPTEGSITLEGKDIASFERAEYQSKIQMIFQDPYSSINPRKKAWQIIAEPLLINSTLSKADCKEKACEMMKIVGLRPELANRYPHMFSGGQRQRIGIARALIQKPEIVICDEPVSALDVSIQAQVLNLLMKLQDEMGLTYLFISHDLSVVKHISDEILVMYLGKIVEYGPREQVFENPLHPYTKALMNASPSLSLEHLGKHEPLQGELPSPLNPPPGCAFHKRCPVATEQCKSVEPSLEFKNNRFISCLEV